MSRFVWVTWIDSEASGGWERPKEIDLRGKIHTVGRVVHETDEVICVAGTWAINGEQFLDGLTIPKCSILEQYDIDFGGA